jgi:hypothetical protein
MIAQLRDVATTLHGRFNMDAVLGTAVHSCRTMLQATAVAVYLVEPQSKEHAPRLVMRCSEGYDLVDPGPTKAEQQLHYALTGSPGTRLGLTAQIALDRRPVLVRTRNGFGRYRHYGTTADGGMHDASLWGDARKCQSFVGVPLLYLRECIGVLKVESEYERYFSHEHGSFLDVLASMIAAAASSCKLREDLAEATKVLAATRPEEGGLQHLVQYCAALCRAEACSLLLHDDDPRIAGLILRADWGHTNNLTNVPGTEDAPRAYIYDGKRDRRGKVGLTWECYDEGCPVECRTPKEVRSSRERANRLWPRQWEPETDKVCHSLLLYPVEGAGDKTLGVLKVENKLNLVGGRMEGGFTESDRFVVEVFADAIALLLRDPGSRGLFGSWTYTPMEVFGARVLDLLAGEETHAAIESISPEHGRVVADRLAVFAGEMRESAVAGYTLDYYSRKVAALGCELATHLCLEGGARELLTGLRDYEVLLRQIPAYREHFVHQFSVFALGLLMLAHNRHLRACLMGSCIDSDALREWFAAAMFHDVGLPIERLPDAVRVLVAACLFGTDDGPSRVRSALTSSDTPVARPAIASVFEYEQEYLAVRDLVTEGLTSPLAAALVRVLHSLAHPVEAAGSRNHSLISACLVGRRLLSCETSITRDMRRRVLSAVVLHESSVVRAMEDGSGAGPTWDEVRRVVSLEANPLAFLLGLCDTIQSWARQERDTGRTRLATADVVLKDLWISDDRVEVNLAYPKQPGDWARTYTEVISPQASVWTRRTSPLRTIQVHFETADDATLEPTTIEFPRMAG